jgi:hypothetical protein
MSVSCHQTPWHRKASPSGRYGLCLALPRRLHERGPCFCAHGALHPATGFNVQHQLDDDPDVSENEYEAIACPACTSIHLVNRKTGKLLGQDDDSSKDPG